MQSQIRKYASKLFEKGQVVELRAIKHTDGTVAGFFDNGKALSDAAASLSGQCQGVYITLNPVNPSLLDRSRNTLTKQTSGILTKDDDISHRRWLLVDVDPVRPSDVSSSESEHAEAISVACAIRSMLHSRGWPEPILADSGNGAHLLYRIDLPNDDESRNIIKGVLARLDSEFSTETQHVDKVVHNAARICKMYGTLSRKGENTDDRPHRLSSIITAPDDIQVVDIDLLAAYQPVVDEKPKQQKHSSGSNKKYAITTLDNIIADISSAQSNRNITLNSGAHKLARLCAAGELQENVCRALLENAAYACGLEKDEILKTIESAFKAGLSDPFIVENAKTGEYLPAKQKSVDSLLRKHTTIISSSEGNDRKVALKKAAIELTHACIDEDVNEDDVFDQLRVAAYSVGLGDGETNRTITSAKKKAESISERASNSFGIMPDLTNQGKPKSSIRNVEKVCELEGITVRYNVIKKEIEVLIPGAGFSCDNEANAALAYLEDRCIAYDVPIGQLGGYMINIADRNQYNPVTQWITSKPWDGVTRLPQLMSTIKAENEADDPSVSTLKEAMLTRWMISAVAAAFEPKGVSAHGVLVLQGNQYLGKTMWFKSLVPADIGVIQDGLILRPEDRDSVKQAVSFWLVELGELDATFRKSDISQLKSFLTKDKDVLRRAYAKLESYYARRTVFFASVNPRQFLHDPTGNRRYWTISCEYLDHHHTIDMQQCWAEVYESLYLKGEKWYLTHDEMALLNGHNKDYEVLSPIKERLQTHYDWNAPKSMWRHVTATAVMSEIGFDKPNSRDVTDCGQFMLEFPGVERKRSNGKNLSLMPPIKRANDYSQDN